MTTRIYSEILGKYLEIPERPKIISLAPSNTEILYTLGEWDSVIGVSLYCHIPLEALNKPRVGAYLKVDYDKLKKLDPDIIFTTTGIQRKLTFELDEKGYPVYPIPLPLSHYDIIGNIMTIGLVLGKINSAHLEAQKLVSLLNKIKRDKYFNIYYEIDFGDPYTVGRYSYITTGLKHIGLENIFIEESKSYFIPDYNEVKARNPDIILYEQNRGGQMTLYKLINRFEDLGLGDINAIRENRIILLDPDSLAHYGPSFFKTLDNIQKKVSTLI